ncbi:MAG: RNA 2',3'-cyclic phosphodiesterase [Candidatus Moranbacteria bacterium]|nr:RNA 2',3'-cyclic phosphodiesterase [Candidatus Moranbacteria bacterium]
MNERRLFFGIPLSEQTRARIAKETQQWESLPLFVTRADHLHVTVFFLGFVVDEVIPDISDVAREICAEIEPFELMFRETVFAPDAERPKMIWLSGDENEGLLLLRNAFEEEFADKLSGNLRFRPHVTLARLKRNLFASVAPERKASLVKPFSILEPVSSVTLFESVGSGAQREYLPMEEFPLGE